MTDVVAGDGLGPALGLSWEGRPVALLAAAAPHVDVVEIVPDCLVGPDGRVVAERLAELDALVPDHDVTYHGIGLSIGSVDGWNDRYLRVLETMLAWRWPRWHSEHLGFTDVDGSFLGTMPCLPPTHEALELVVARVSALRHRYGLEFMLEHVATPLDRPGDMPLADFLNAIADRTGSRLLLDLHNLECDADNGLLDLDDFLSALDWSAVGEIHVAGGVVHDGWHLDVHSGPVADSTLALLRLALDRADDVGLAVYEVLAEAVPTLGTDTIVDQLRTVRAVLDEAVLAPGGAR